MNKNIVRGSLLAVKGAGIAQLFALLTGITEVSRCACVRCICWLMVAVGLVLLFLGLGLAALGESGDN